MTDDASLLTNACALLDRYRADLPELEADIAARQARADIMREAIDALTGKPRIRRQRLTKETTIIEMPTRTDGGLAEPETAA